MVRGRAPTPAVAVLTRAGVEFELHTYRHDAAASSYGGEAVDALGVDPARVHKTLLVATGHAGGDLSTAIVAVRSQLDLKALASALGVRKVHMAEPGHAQRRTGYVVGGISPLGQSHDHPTVLDAAADEHDTIFVSGGRRGLEIELAPADLARLTDALWASISRS